MADGVIFLTADFGPQAGVQTTATISRGPTSSGPWVDLDTVDLLNEVGIYNDTSVPLDTVVWYRWMGQPGDRNIVQGPYIEVSDGTVLLKDPLRPWANLSVDFCDTATTAMQLLCDPDGPRLVWIGFGDEVRRADAHLFDIYQSETPADLYGRRKRLDGSFQVLAKTLEASDAMHALLTAGGPIQIQMPTVYGFPDAFVQPGDVTRAYLGGQRDQRMPFRVWSMPFTVVERPLGPQQGTDTANWCALQEQFATYQDLTNAGLTWAQVANGSAVSPDDGYGLGPYGSGPYGDGG